MAALVHTEGDDRGRGRPQRRTDASAHGPQPLEPSRPHLAGRTESRWLSGQRLQNVCPAS